MQGYLQHGNSPEKTIKLDISLDLSIALTTMPSSGQGAGQWTQATMPGTIRASNMKLFLVVLGGRIPGCHIEAHDVRWVAAETIDAAIPELKRQWIGPQKGLHLDSYCQVNVVDGHHIEIRTGSTSKPSKPLLWFVNLGAYDADQLAEQHQFGLIVANNKQAATSAAKRRWLRGLKQVHTDDRFTIDNTAEIETCLPIEGQGQWHVQLTPTARAENDSGRPDWFGYRPI